MNKHWVEELIGKIKSRFIADTIIPTRREPVDIEYTALRETMRGQFLKLKEKGLSIRIITL